MKKKRCLNDSATLKKWIGVTIDERFVPLGLIQYHSLRRDNVQRDQ